MSDSSKNGVRYKCLDFMGFPNYWVGDDGSLWSDHYGRCRELAKCYEPNYGYQVQVLCEKGKRKTVQVHRVVLLAFVGPRPEGMECCHNDNDPKNNALVNLRYDTKKNNHDDRRRRGKTPQGEKNYGAKITADTVRQIRRWHKEGWTERAIREELGLSKAQVNKIINGKSWTHVT